MPKYDLNEDGHGVLTEEYIFENTPFRSWIVNSEMISISPDGILFIAEGYVWDFASGAVDTPALVYGSLGHDAMYDLRNQGKLLATGFTRKAIDKWFKGLLKEAGMGWFRRQYIYLAVRLGYKPAKVLGFV